MASDTTRQITNLGTGSAPFDYTVPGAQEFTLLAVRATFDGSGAAGAFLPAVQLVSDAGSVMVQTKGDTVAAGGSADASFFPLVRRTVSGGGVSYADRITLLKAKYTCVAEWRLTEGASPWHDTSGFNPGSPADATIQVRVVPMTQNNPSGPLAEAPAGPSVAFNFDGTNLTNQGDFLQAGGLPIPYYFAGNAIFTAVAWVLPGAGVNTHEGPLMSVVHVTGFGAPGAHDDGWMLDVSQPDLLPKFRRYSNVLSGGLPDEAAAASALPTNRWSMLVGTYDGATIKLYVNGVLIASHASAGAIGGSNNNLTMGLGTINQGNTATWYYGAVSQASVWAATFTAQDVADLYAAASV